jgi:hypothetical protein
MKYIKALEDKGLQVENLSRKIRTNIQKLEKFFGVLLEVNLEDLDEDSAKDYNNLKDQVEKLDDEVTRDINKFDVEKYKEKVERVKKLPNKNKKEVSEPKVEEPLNQKTQADEEVKKLIEAKLGELKESVQVDASTMYLEDEPDEVDAVEEFEKVAEVKPKKGSWSKIAVGVGALILTWGLVNILKEK